MSARSADGVNWQRSGEVLVEQSGTPSMVLGPQGLPLLYTTAHKVDGQRDGFAVSIGSADGRTWQHCQVTLQGFPANLRGVDPDVVALASGGYRIYLTGTVGSSRIAIYYADSTDGITWTYGGVAFEQADSILDSVTFRVGDAWHMYALVGTKTEMVHGVSGDGKTFTATGSGPILVDGKAFVLSQALVTGNQPRVFGFVPPGLSIKALETADGTTWKPATSNALELDISRESKFIRDPAVVRLADGTYLMTYATPIP